MRYLITGITGFAGPHLANLLLSNKHEVVGLVRGSNGMETDILDVVPKKNFDKIQFIHGDITHERKVFDLFSNDEFDGVFHLAAQSHPPTSFADPLGTFNDNIMGSANIIEAVIKHGRGCRIMFCSTSEVYGNIGADRRKIKEDDKILPANPYGVSKAAIDLYMQERIISGKINGFITRAFSHTGPRRGKKFSISSDAFQLASMKDGDTLNIGNLETTRVVMDVQDTVNAYYLLMLSQKQGVFNVCGNTPRKMSYFTDKLIELSGLKDIKKFIHPNLFRPIDISYQHGDTSALEQATPWQERINIDRTLKDLLNYWRNKIG
jgi:nucleoside-diphosphate-sugar epimerase